MSVLIVVAHPDDEALGCGGTIAALSASREVDVLFLADGETARGAEDSVAGRQAAACEAASLLGANKPHFLTFPDNRMDGVPLLEIIQEVENVLEKLGPSIVFTHHGGDLNVDHRLTHEAVMTACRPLPGSTVQEIYGMEILSSTEWALPNRGCAFEPQVFFDISDQMELKRRALQCYDAEMRPFPHSRSYESVEALAKSRGASVGLRAAEAFSLLRMIRRPGSD